MADHAKSGPPTPRLSSSSNPLALPPSSSPIDINATGAATVSPPSSLGADSRRLALSSSGREGFTNYQPLPQAPAFHTSEISNATRAFGRVTLYDSRSAEGYSDSMICSTAMKLQLMMIGYISRPQGAQKTSTRSTNAQVQPEVISHGARNQRRKISSSTS